MANIMAKHPFVVGGRYRNRRGEYQVLALDGRHMRVRYDDGQEHSLDIARQAHIWQSILDEEAPPSPTLRRRDLNDDTLDTAPIRQFVAELLQRNFAYPHPPDITDQVCLAIEANPEWLARYHHLVEHFSSGGRDGRSLVNNYIGSYTKELTGMVTVKKDMKAKSRLLSKYSQLGYQRSG
jgi:hypothetical protein